MNKNLLVDIYNNNKGKVSDKWSLYLHEYNHIFSSYRSNKISLLEIGIQNGGSLQAWADYFPEAVHLIGCDINPLCEELVYEDSRISVVVGDANDQAVRNQITSISKKFDLIIDDGSHTSGDIIKSFNLYFSSLEKNGVFIVEDLHCSYWDSFEGGLYYPYSSINFFKSLADVVNFEHWGVNKSRSQLLNGFYKKYNISIDEFSLREIHSIEFVNSMCIVRKCDVDKNTLGHRIITGLIETAAPSHSYLNGSPYELDINNFDQSTNAWSTRMQSPGEAIDEIEKTLGAREQEIVQLSQVASERDQEIAQLSQVVSTREQEIAQLSQVRDSLERDFAECLGYLRAMEGTISWRITRPIRGIKHRVKAFSNWFGSVGSAPPSQNQAQEIVLDPGNHISYGCEPAFLALSGKAMQQENSDPILKDDAKLITFYLPQYHEIPENSEWWGDGFTEWTNVKKGLPNFDGHYQPHVPADLGYYDLSSVEVMEDQAEMAKLFGVHGFCFYYYWFSGRRVLERPIENFLNSDVDINFCLCWANENWTRTWDGDTKSVLLHQKYAPEDDESFIESLVPYFKDKRYIFVGGNPLLVVYRAKEIPNTKEVFKKWRLLAKQFGFKGLHIAVVDFYDIQSPNEVDADALVEFPPHKFNGPNSYPEKIPLITNPKFSGGIVDYNKIIAQSANREVPNFKLYRGLIPSWDNTARRQDTPTIIVNETPAKFGAWLSYIRAYTRKYLPSKEDNFIFINAWNEWGEGCHLEPDEKRGMQFLEEAVRSSYYSEKNESLVDLREQLYRTLAMESESSGGLSLKQQDIMGALYNQRPQSQFVQSVKEKLRNNKFLYSVARVVYRIFYRQP